MKPHYRPLSVLLLACAASAPAFAAAERDSAAQYSSQAPVSVTGKQAIVQLKLSRDVYLRSQSAELNDVRLFDADGNKIGFSLINPVEQRRTTRSSVPVRSFPVFDSGKAGQGTPQEVEIKTSSDGSLLSVSTKGKVTVAGRSSTLASLILDLRPGAATPAAGPTPLVSALNLSLPTGVTSYSAKVALEVSDDLKSWNLLCESPLNWLVNAKTDVLANSRIEFLPTAFRYARLTWIEGAPIEFGQINAEFETTSALPYDTETLVVSPQDGHAQNDLLYPTPVAVPAVSLGLELQQQNFVLPAVLGQYVDLPGRGPTASSRHQFSPRLRFTFYQLNQGSQRKSGTTLAIAPVHADHWVLRPEASLPEKPLLRISWHPSTMVFVANGRAPYTLAVGRAGAASAHMPLAKVAPGFTMEELFSSERAELGSMSAARATGPGPEGGAQSAQRRVAVLWFVLLLGVGILGLMAWRLTAQMRNSGQ